MPFDMPPDGHVVRLTDLVMVAAVERHRTDKYVVATERTLAYYRSERHAIRLVLHKDGREDPSLRVEAAVDDGRMSVEISLNLFRCDEPVRENAVAVELAGRMLAKTVLTEVSLACDTDATATVRTAMSKEESFGHYFDLSILNFKVSEILFPRLVLHRQDA